MTTKEQSVAALLDETIAALSEFDLERLLSLEEKTLLLTNSGITGGSIPSLVERQQILVRLLEATQSNIAGLARIHQRDGANAWVR
jgi:flagellar biosynthesis/type III secretory pathway chaperone